MENEAEALSRGRWSWMIFTAISIGFFAIVGVLLITHVSLSRVAIIAVGIAQLFFIPGFLLTLVCSPMRVRAALRGGDESDGAWDIVERTTIAIASSIVISSGVIFALARARRMFVTVFEVTPADFIALALAFDLILIALALVRAHGARWLPWAIGTLGATVAFSMPLIGGVRMMRIWVQPVIGATAIAMIGAMIVVRLIARWRITENAHVMTFLRYCVVGFTSTFIDFAAYATLTRGWDFWRAHFFWANTISFTIAVTWGFFWHKHWSFRERSIGHIVQYVKFWTVTTIGLTIAQVVLFASVRAFAFPDLLGKALAAPFVVAWNFLAHRFWTFRTSGPEDDTIG